MTKKFVSAFIITAFVFASTCAFGQNNNPSDAQKDKKSVVKINKLDVIYQDEDYSGIVIDQKEMTKEDESYEYQRPLVMTPPPAVEQEEPTIPNFYQMNEDEGVESEDDILYASFDSEVIHYPKIDLSTWKDTVTIHLVNHRKNQEFSYPTPSTSRLTSHFGARRRRWHYGIDLAMPTGEPIYAAFDGVVRISKYNSSYGNLIVIRHNNGLETYYAHMSQRNVQPNDSVKSGQVIGLCGNTGRSYGSHLHFEIRYMGAAMNPEHVIDCTKQTLVSETLNLTPASFRKVGSASAGNVSGTGSSKPAAQYYKVRSGDTLSKIAKRNGTTVKKLCQLNGIKETTVLSIGRRLRVR